MKIKPGFWPAFFLEIGWRGAIIGVPLAMFAWWLVGFSVADPVFVLGALVVLAPVFLLLTVFAYAGFRGGVRAVDGYRLPENWDTMSAQEQAAFAASLGTYFF